MGLDAVVYRSKRSLPFDPEAVGAVLEPTTGEYYFDEPSQEKAYPSDSRTAVDKRLGNVSAIAELRAIAERVLGRESVVCCKVLYSGSHSGDPIPPSYLEQLRNELARLHAGADSESSLLAEFLADMKELIAAAVSEGNPIVFV